MIQSPGTILSYVIAGVLAFFLPGFLWGRWLRASVSLTAGFILSLMILCQGFIWLEIIGVPLRLGTMLVWELIWTLAGAILVFRQPRRAAVRSESHRASAGWFWLVLVVITGLILLLRSALVPLTGPDVMTREGCLARQVLKYGNYHFYPPVTAHDFRYYGVADSLPPMLTAVYWWLYAAVGRVIPNITAPFIAFQFAAVAALVYRLGRQLSSSMGAALAATLLAATPLVFFSLVLGQDAGLLAIGGLALIYFVMPDDEADAPGNWHSAVLAGTVVSLAPLARNYALVYLLLALVLAILYRRSWRWIGIAALTAAALLGPWYIRTWIRTGNPVYSLPVFHLFPVNPIIAAQYQIAGAARSFWKLPASTWKLLGVLLLGLAPLPLVLVWPALVASFRRRRELGLVIAFVIFAGLWLISLGLSDSLLIWLRTLLPAVAVGAVLMAVKIEPLFKKIIAVRMLIICVLILSWIYAAIFGLVYPRRLSQTPPAQWAAAALSTRYRHWDQAVIDARIPQHLPPGCRVLTTDTYAYAALLDSRNPAVPLWSPEVSFIFNSSMTLPAIYKQLHQHHICAVWFQSADLQRYPANHLYQFGPAHWQALSRSGNSILYRLPE